MECRGSARLPGTQIASTLAPTNHCRFDGVAGIHALPSAAPPSTQERNNIRADVILAKELKRLAGRRYAFVNEGIDSLLPCRHAVLIIRAGGGFDTYALRRRRAMLICLYMTPLGTEQPARTGWRSSQITEEIEPSERGRHASRAKRNSERRTRRPRCAKPSAAKPNRRRMKQAKLTHKA
jgi:hypothetical protein